MITKGEWKVEVDEYDGTINIATETQNIAKMCFDDQHTLKANANLIVTAVNACKKINPDNPQAAAESIEDMYEALKTLLDLYVKLALSGDAGFWNPETEDEVKQARQALAKADRK